MKKHTIFYRHPAGSFAEALPVGSGFLGAMPLGEVFHERINLNEDTFWSGYPRANGLDNAYERVTKRLRKKIREGLFEEAEDLADKLQGPYSESYLSVGELRLDCPQDGEFTAYTRGLDISSGLS